MRVLGEFGEQPQPLPSGEVAFPTEMLIWHVELTPVAGGYESPAAQSSGGNRDSN